MQSLASALCSEHSSAIQCSEANGRPALEASLVYGSEAILVHVGCHHEGCWITSVGDKLGQKIVDGPDGKISEVDPLKVALQAVLMKISLHKATSNLPPKHSLQDFAESVPVRSYRELTLADRRQGNLESHRRLHGLVCLTDDFNV